MRRGRHGETGRCHRDPGAFFVKILLDEASVQRGVRKLATDVETVFADRPLTIVGLMTGSIVLLAALLTLNAAAILLRNRYSRRS